MTILTIFLSIAAIVVSLYSVWLSRRQGLAAVRSELLNYARSMGSLDRKAARVNSHQIGMLGRQVEVLIEEYGQDKLRLPASFYRIVADYLAIATDETSVASKFCDQAQQVAATDNDVLEHIRIQRVRGEIAAREVDLPSLKTSFAQAITIAEQYAALPNRYAISEESLTRTYAYALFSALLAAQRGGGADAHALAREYFDKAQSHGLQGLLDRRSLEVARRAQLIHEPDAVNIEGLSVKSWKEIWSNRNRDGL